MRWIPKDEVFADIQAAESFLITYLTNSKDWPFARWAVTRISDGAWLGWAGLRKGTDGSVDLGYRLHRFAWGNGYATEAGKTWLLQGFGLGNLSRIVAHAADGNTNSHRVLQRLGFQRSTDADFAADGFLWYRFHVDRPSQGQA